MNEGQAMRDIRGDLQDRAALLEEQINAHEAQFDKLIEQLKREHDSRLEDLKTELEAVNRLLELELRRIDTAPAAQRGQGRDSVRLMPCISRSSMRSTSTQQRASPPASHRSTSRRSLLPTSWSAS